MSILDFTVQTQDGNIVHNVSFMGGCNRNLKAIPILIGGRTVKQIKEKLAGVLFGCRPTSCAGRLAKIVCVAYEEGKTV